MENIQGSQESITALEASVVKAPLQYQPIKFHGNAKDFFNIWIVNMLLTIVTLGIYSAWAKVRTNRYLYSNLDLDGHRFSYLAQPIQILKGRIIAVLLFGGYFLLSSFSPFAAGIFIGLLFILTPFLLVMSFRFGKRMTAYRNIRFGFDGKPLKAFLYFTLFPILAIFTFYLAMPWIMKKMDEFLVGNIRYGKQKFTTKPETSEYYAASLASGLISIPFFILIFAVMPSAEEATVVAPSLFSLQTILPLFVYAVMYLTTSSYYQATIRNHIYSLSEVENCAKLHSEAEVLPLMQLKLTNFVAIIVTLGLAMPWAKIRTVKYWAEATAVATLPGANDIIADESDAASATADEVADVFDIDVAIG